MQFSSSLISGHAIEHLTVSAESQMNASMIHQPFKYHCGMHCLYFSKAADAWWQEHMSL
jgi:hypothetical protein